MMFTWYIFYGLEVSAWFSIVKTLTLIIFSLSLLINMNKGYYSHGELILDTVKIRRKYFLSL